MLKGSLISLIRSLNPDEIKEFGYFVRSPFFNRNHGLIKLYEYLKIQYPEFHENNLVKEKVYTQVFEKAKYNDGFMRVLISNLTKLLEEYLSFKNYKRRPSRDKLFLINELNLRRLAKEFKSSLKDAENKIEMLPKTDMWYFHDRALLEDNKYYFNQWNRSKWKNSKLFEEQSLKSIIDNFTRFYLVASLVMFRKVMHMNIHGKVNVDLNFTEEILKLLEKHSSDFSDTPVINLHLNEILLLSKGDKKHYDTLKNIFLNRTDQFTYVESYSLLNILQKHATNQVLKGIFIYEKEKFTLYKAAISGKILLFPFQKHIEGNIFYSIINSALNVNEISWTEKFIRDNEQYLNPGDKELILNLSLAKLDYKLDKIDKALMTLKSIKTKNIEFLLNIKIILMKIYFEKSLYDESEMVMDSFRHLLRRAEQSFAELIYKSYRNFLTVYTMLLKSKEKGKREPAYDAILFIKKNKAVQDYRWTKDKAKELLN